MDRIAVILGAGASHDVYNGFGSVADLSAKPPLADQLFEERFWNIQREYPGVKLLGSKLGRLAQIAKGTFN